MKRLGLVYSLSWCLVLLIGLTRAAMAQPAAGPVVVHNSWRIDPGEVVGLYGGGFGAGRAGAGAPPEVTAFPLSQGSGEE